MNRLAILGTACTVVGSLGYLVGIVVPYRGRAFSVTVLMVGITLIAIRRVHEGGVA